MIDKIYFLQWCTGKVQRNKNCFHSLIIRSVKIDCIGSKYLLLNIKYNNICSIISNFLTVLEKHKLLFNSNDCYLTLIWQYRCIWKIAKEAMVTELNYMNLWLGTIKRKLSIADKMLPSSLWFRKKIVCTFVYLQSIIVFSLGNLILSDIRTEVSVNLIT